MTESYTIKIALIDDEVLFRQGLKSLLECYADIHIEHESSNGQEFIDYLENEKSYLDIVLLDLQMPELNGIEVAKILSEKYPDIKIIVLSSHFSHGMVYNMLELGVSSYLVKNSNTKVVYKTICEVYGKGFYYSSEIQDIINQGIANKKRQKRIDFDHLVTPREKEILKLICQQYTNAEIAKTLFISPRTVDGHRHNLLKKLNRKNTAGLVAYAIQKQIISLDASHFW